MASKVGWMVTYLDELLPRKSNDPCDKLKLLYLPFLTSLATKQGRMVTYFDALLSIKSCDALIMWSCEIT